MMVSNLDRLAEAFQQELFDAYLEAKVKYHYHATRFFQMLEEHGGVETARRLLSTTSTTQTGLTEMWKCGRLDLTVEAKVLIPKFEPLFTPELRRIARERLVERKFPVDAWLKGLQTNRFRAKKH